MERCMSDLVLLLLNFVSALSVLVLVAVSLGLIFGQLGIINLAQGDLVMVGAFAMYATRELPFLVGVATALVLGLLLGVVLERGLARALYGRGLMPALLATWGVGIVLRQAADALYSSTPHAVAAPVGGSVGVLGVDYPTYRILVAVVVAVVVAAVLAVAYRSSLGLRMRACIDNLEMAALLGTSPQRMFMLVFVAGTVLAVLAGSLAAPIVGVTPTLGLSYLPAAFFAVLLGRPGSIGGPVLGAALVAFLTVLLNRFFTATVAQSLLFAALVLFIAVRPEGVRWHPPARRTRPLQPARGGPTAAS